jgi:hypothetical protein
MLDLNKALLEALPTIVNLLFVRLWYVWPILIALGYLRARVDRAEEKRRTERRVRDEMEARERIERERDRGRG